jgi:hypothetical protein
MKLSIRNYLYAWNTEDLTFKYFFGKSFLLGKGVYNLKESEKPENTNVTCSIKSNIDYLTSYMV